MVILVDMDDTIEHLLEAWCNYLNHKYGLSVVAKDVKNWDLRLAFPELEREQILEPLSLREFWITVAPKSDAIKYLQQLHDDGDEIYIVTAATIESIKFRFDYIIKRYFPYISWDQVIVASNKQMIAGDVLIDDGPHNLIGGRYEKILMDAPHNQLFEAEEKGIIRAKTWEDVYKDIQEIKCKKRDSNEGY